MSNTTEKQRKYAEGRAEGLKPKQAALAAGYSPSTADKQAYGLEARADIQDMIKAAKKAKGVKKGRPPKDDDETPVMKAKYGSSLDLMRDMYNNPRLPYSVRFEAAKQALPYEHARIGEKGKKEQRADAAKVAVAKGRFRPLDESNVVSMRRRA